MASTTFRLRVWTRYFAPTDRVWAHKTDPLRLVEEFLPYALFLTTDVLNADGDTLLQAARAGRPAQATGLLLPPGLPWPMTLVRSIPGEMYEDHSQNLLYARFEHQHLFEPTPDGCRYIDDVIFRPAPPVANKLIAILTERMFVHRHRVAARRLPADKQTIGTSVLRVLIEEPQAQAQAQEVG